MATNRRRTMTLAIEVDADDVEKGTAKAEVSVSKFSRRVDTAIGNITARAFEAAGQAVKDFVGDIARLAVGAETTERRAATVFGNYANLVEDWADRVNESFGVSRQGALDMAAAIGDLLIPLGFTREQVAKIAPEIAEAGNAFSEFTGHDVQFAIEAIGKALLGEREQLKSLGIVVREEDLKMERLLGTFQGVTGETEAQAKALNTLQLIYERGADALAAYEDRGDSLLAKQKELTASYEDAKLALAEQLTPALNDAALAGLFFTDVLDGQIDNQDQSARGALVLAETFANFLSPAYRAQQEAARDLANEGKNQGIEVDKLQARWSEFVAAQKRAAAQTETLNEALRIQREEWLEELREEIPDVIAKYEELAAKTADAGSSFRDNLNPALESSVDLFSN